ncbi:hypothetical protein C8Q72DRAFT_798350 [Fomitopsis betulina]|nr:hypothetical protein C8Q72DRAFT_798350 [Fomitopsis betulina]
MQLLTCQCSCILAYAAIQFAHHIQPISSGLFTVRFSGKYLPLDATTVRTLAFIFLCFRRPVGAKPTWTPWPRWRLDRQPPEVLPANTLCNPLAVVARPRHSNSILSLMQSSLTQHTIGPQIVSSEEDDYPLDAPSPRPLFDDGSDQVFAPSSPPTEGGGTLSSINPTQCISERSITPSDFEGSADEDDDLELLVEHIKSWSLSRDVFGELLDDMNFPELQDCAEIKNLTEAQWQDLLSFIQENTSILRFKFYYMSKTGTVHITSRAPGSNHEGGVHALFEGFKHDISLSQYQVFVEDHNRRVVARDVGEIPDGIVAIYYRRPIRDILSRKHGSVDILADIAVFESVASQSVQSVVGALIGEMADCEEPAKVERAEGVGDGEVQNDTEPYRPIKPRLFCSIKYIYVKFQLGTALEKQGIEEGALATGIATTSYVCARRAFWFAFRPEDRDTVEALNADLRTCWDWVAQGYAMPLLSTYDKEKLVHSDLYPEARIDQILSVHAKVMKHWQDGVADARTLAVRQCVEAGWCQAMTLREVDYSKVPLEDPLRGHHLVAELKRMDVLVLKQSREDVASIDTQNNGPIANPIPIFLQAIRDGCFQHADGKYSKNGYRVFMGPPPPKITGGRLKRSNDDIFDLFNIAECAVTGNDTADDKVTIARETKCRRVVVHPPVNLPEVVSLRLRWICGVWLVFDVLYY